MNFDEAGDSDSELQFPHWNNWVPQKKPPDTVSCSEIELSDTDEKICNTQGSGNSVKRKNLLPQYEAHTTDVRAELKLIREEFEKERYTPNNKKERRDSNEEDLFSRYNAMNENGGISDTEWKINEDWGKRTELHRILQSHDGDKLWFIVRRGIFGDIKLWKNQYGNICCKASGKISVQGSKGNSLLEINTEQNLRKFLNISQFQWSALCEAVNEKNCTLNFNAFHNFDSMKSSSLEKLWFFICKRRHFLPDICIFGKLCGAVKLMMEFEVVPKIVVSEIRDFKGEEIC